MTTAIGSRTVTTSPEVHDRVSAAYVPGVVAMPCATPLTLTVAPDAQAGIRIRIVHEPETLPVTLRRVLQHRRITYETVLGALCSYVLLGLLFAFCYLAVDSLREAPFFSQPGEHSQSEFLYFSFVSLTTLGFGDLSPTVGLPQALTVLEALLGQVFLVTLVARLVTLWVRQSETTTEEA